MHEWVCVEKSQLTPYKIVLKKSHFLFESVPEFAERGSEKMQIGNVFQKGKR